MMSHLQNKRAIQERVDPEFASNVRKLYPLEISFREKTKRLNQVLEEMLHGKKK